MCRVDHAILLTACLVLRLVGLVHSQAERRMPSSAVTDRRGRRSRASAASIDSRRYTMEVSVLLSCERVAQPRSTALVRPLSFEPKTVG